MILRFSHKKVDDCDLVTKRLTITPSNRAIALAEVFGEASLLAQSEAAARNSISS